MRNTNIQDKLNKNFRKTRIISISILSFSLLCLVGIFFFLTFHQTRNVEATKKPTIALVNEDLSGKFNQQNYNFGKDFVNLVSNDNKYNWQVVSRAVADKAYTDKSVDAVIYIPQSFSQDILTLQELNPTKAEVDYKVLKSQSELSERLLQDKITNILYDFNQNIVKMYYASVAGNIAEAQNNMNGVVGNQSNLLKTLSNNIYPNFNQTNQGYSSVIGFANGLKSENAGWISAQNAFTESTKKGLNSTSTSLKNQLPQLTDFFTTQKNILSTNLFNGNQALRNQGTSDKNFYDSAFSHVLNQLQTGNGAWSGFNGLSNANNTGMLNNLNANVSDYNALALAYNDKFAKLKTDLQSQLETLNTSNQDLQSFEKSLLQEYFNQAMDINDSNYQVDSSSLTASMAKEGLAQKVSHSFSDNSPLQSTLDKYQNQILNLVQAISVDPSDYQTLFDALSDNTTVDIAKYKNELNLIQSYATAFSVTNQPKLNLVYSKDTVDQKAIKKLTFTIPADTNVTLSGTIDGAPITFDSIIDGSGKTYTSDASGIVMIENKNEGTPNTTGSNSGIDNALPAVPTTPLTVTATYTVDFANKTASNVQTQVKDATSGNTLTQNNADYLLMPADATKEKLGSTDFEEISTYLSNIDSASHLMLFLYGKPGQSLTDYISQATSANYSFTVEPTSVYKRYGAIDNSIVEQYFKDTDQDVLDYQKLGKENVEAIIKQIDAVQNMRETVQSDLTTLDTMNLNPDFFTANVTALNNWYNQAQALLNGSQEKWNAQNNGVTQLEPKVWQSQEKGKPELYSNEEASSTLYKTISQIVATSSDTATNTAKSAQLIKDNSNEFENLVKNVNETKSAAQKTLDNTNNAITTGTKSLKESDDYKTNFGTVLANTRNNNSGKVFDFFAQPLNAKDLTPKVQAATVKNFDWRWLIVFAGGILLGTLGMIIVHDLKEKEKQ